jgi:esterase/lipase superfamily enzyme
MNEWDVRPDKQGDFVRDDVKVSSQLGQLNHSRLIVLIHGYNNTRAKARRSFEKFRGELRINAWCRDEKVLGSFVGFHWPGDHWVGLISAMSFNARVQSAERAGRRLAAHLATLDRRQEVVLVAHSLGCRVALEAVERIQTRRDYEGPRIRDVFLLAAAVPTSLCEDEAKFQRSDGCRQHVLHSTRDRILRFAFPWGEYTAGDVEKRGPAVGFRGGPARRRWDESEPTRLTHGQYWSSFRIADHVGALLGPRHSRHLAADGLEAEEIRLESRSLPERPVDERNFA